MSSYGDPGLGDPDGIASAGSDRTKQAEKLRRAHGVITGAVSDSTDSGWSGQAQIAFTHALSRTLPQVALLADGLDAQGAALQTYATEVRSIIDERDRLRSARTAADLRRANADGDLRIREIQEAEGYDPPYQRVSTWRLQQDVLQAQNEVAAIDEQLAALLERRRTADLTCSAALSTPQVRGGLAGISGSAYLSADALLTLIAGLSADDLAVLLKTQPGLAQELLAAAPEDVAKWWPALTSEQQLALVVGAPLVIGKLGGVPPLARVEANKLNAAARLKELELDIAEREANRMRDGRVVHADTLERLKTERDYLKRAVAGVVQLYLYDRENQSIIEMFGTPGLDTGKIVTYVPGTFTSMHSFYGDGVQDIARSLAQDPGTVSFVWKVGLFPGENTQTGAFDLFRINEANVEATVIEKARLLAGFQHEVQASMPILRGAEQIGVGHSWGLTPITGAEAVGKPEDRAHWDQVHSLAGAGVIEAWSPQEGTTYRHWSYPDLLTVAQESGAVWNGRTPQNTPAFESRWFEGGLDLLDNHNRVATSDADNSKVLEALKKAMAEG